MRSQILAREVESRAPPCTGLSSQSRISNPLLPCHLPRRPILDLATRPIHHGISTPSSIAASGATSGAASTSGRTLPNDFNVTSPNGRWRVRLINKDDKNEVAYVVRLQADGFHTPNPLPFLDSTFKRFFTAEVCWQR